MKPIIRVEGLSKQYRIGQAVDTHATFRDAILKTIRAPFRRPGRDGDSTRDTIWALRDVSFEVAPGEVLGIIGRNGAGKSTLLKILSRITEPTTGSVDIYGRIASLLEVGTAFHPELTGRENVFLNGAVLGMKRNEIARKFDEIVAFSEIEKFLDTPVKRYSSGMQARLAFAVAAHLEPEILIVDEVLAVGDTAFQRKCMGKMQNVAGEGRTILFVTHNMQAVSTLTQRSLMLVRGRCVHSGPTADVITEYLKDDRIEEAVYVAPPLTGGPHVTRVEVCTSEPGNSQLSGKGMEVRLEVSTPVPIDGARISVQVCNQLGQPIQYFWAYDSDQAMCRKAGVFRFVCRIPKVRLYMGFYNLTVHLAERDGGKKFETIEGICPFQVVLYGRQREGGWSRDVCAYFEDCEWEISEHSVERIQ